MATRRQFTSEFKLEIVKMVIDQGGSIGKLSKDLSINDNLIRRWVKQYQLERENQSLRSDVELLKKASAFFARTIK